MHNSAISVELSRYSVCFSKRWRWWLAGFALLGIPAMFQRSAHFQWPSTSLDASVFAVIASAVLFLIAERKAAFRKGSAGNWYSPLLALAGIAIAYVGWLANSGLLAQVSWIVLAWAAMCLPLSSEGSKSLLPILPLALCLTDVQSLLTAPIALPLATWNASVAGTILQTLGMDIEVLGTHLSARNVDIEVADACDGLSLVWVVLSMSYAYALSLRLSALGFAVLVIVTPAIAIVLNSGRILLVAGFYAFQVEDLARVFHDASGLALTVMAGIVPLGVVKLMQVKEELQGQRLTATDSNNNNYFAMLLCLLLLVLFSVGSTGVARANSKASNATRTRLLERIPYSIGGYFGKDQPISDRQLAILQPDDFVNRKFYSFSSEKSFVLTATQHTRDWHKERKHDVTRCYAAVGWELVSSTHQGFQDDATGKWDVRSMAFTRDTSSAREQAIVVNELKCAQEGETTRVQIVFEASQPESERMALVQEIVRRLQTEREYASGGAPTGTGYATQSGIGRESPIGEVWHD